MTFEQLPKNEQEQLRKAFLNDPGILKLEQASIMYQKNHNYIAALECKKSIEKEWEYVKQEHCKDYDRVINETVKLSELHLSHEVLQPLLENLLTIFMCCDIIDTAYFNANEILKKVNKSYSIDNFSDLVSLIKNVKKKINYLQDTTGYMDDLIWGDSCDKHYEMLKSKSRSILKKKDDINRWGQNLKKYIDGTL